MRRWLAALGAMALAVVALPIIGPGAAGAAAPQAPVLTSYPIGTVDAGHIAFGFYSPGGADYYECRTYPTGSAAPAWTICAGGGSGYHQADLAKGDQTFEVRGAVDSEPGPSTSRSWTITSAPIVQWIDEPSGTLSSRDVTATFTGPPRRGSSAAWTTRCRGRPVTAGAPATTSCRLGGWSAHPSGARHRGRHQRARVLLPVRRSRSQTIWPSRGSSSRLGRSRPRM